MSEDGPPLGITSRDELEVAWVMRRHELDDSTWRRLWRRFRDREDIPCEPVVLYRGAAPENRRGMSWTQTRATAARFAGLWGEQTGAAVWVTTAPPSAILGRPLDDEVVVDPRRLGRVTQARSAEPHEARRREKAAQQRAEDYVQRKRDDARRARRRQQARDDARRARRRQDAALRRRRERAGEPRWSARRPSPRQHGVLG